MTKFIRVTQEQFYSVMNPRDVHPRPKPDRTIWETPTHEILGVSTPGYRCEGEKTYSVRADLVKA